jgi:hypothetical protein
MKYILIMIITLSSLISCSQLKKKKSKQKKVVSNSKYYSGKRVITLHYGPSFSSFTPIAYPLKVNDLEVDLRDSPLGLVCKVGSYGKTSNLRKFILKSKASGNYKSLYCKYNNYVDFGERELVVYYSIDKPVLRVMKEEVDYFKLKSLHETLNPNYDLIRYIDKSSQNNEVVILNKKNGFSESIKIKRSTVFVNSFSHTSNGVFCRVGDKSFDSTGRESLIMYNFTGKVTCTSSEKALVTLKVVRYRTTKQDLFKERKIIEVYDEAKIELNELLFNIDYINIQNTRSFRSAKKAYYTRDKVERKFPQYIEGSVNHSGLELRLNPKKLTIVSNKKSQQSFKQFEISIFDNVEFTSSSTSVNLKYKPFTFYQNITLDSSEIWDPKHAQQTNKVCRENISNVIKEFDQANHTGTSRVERFQSISYQNREEYCQKNSSSKFRIPRSRDLYYIGESIGEDKLKVTEIGLEYKGNIDGHTYEKTLLKEAPKKYLGKTIKKSNNYLIINTKIHSKRDISN